MAWYCDSCQACAARLDAWVRVMEGNLAGIEAKIVRVDSRVMDNTRRMQDSLQNLYLYGCTLNTDSYPRGKINEDPFGTSDLS